MTAHKRIQELEAQVVDQGAVLVGTWARVDRLGGMVDLVVLEVVEVQVAVASEEALVVETVLVGVLEAEVLAAADTDNLSNI